MTSDRIFGLVVLCVALAFIASAFQIQTSFLSDPVGPKSFPVIIGSIAAICALFMIVRPDPDPQWPGLATFAALTIAVVVLVGYAYALKPLGFIVPTLIAASVLSYQLRPRALPALVTGVGLSIGLFVLFKFVLGLGLFAFPRGWFV
jgi:putative tricarboxylic transport membrane protein